MQDIIDTAPVHAEDRPQPAQHLLEGLSQIAAVLAAGNHPDAAALESIRRLGCHICREAGQEVCASDAVPVAGCPLGLDAIKS